ncbi:MAG: leucine-rich repeat protein [Saccharofermentanales bacterium]
MKKHLYLRIQTFLLVLLILLTTIVVNPQQVQAETTVAGEEESISDVSCTESQNDLEQTDIETGTTDNADFFPDSDNEASPENNPVSINCPSEIAVDSEIVSEDKSLDDLVESPDENLTEPLFQPEEEDSSEPLAESETETETDPSESSSEQIADQADESEQIAKDAVPEDINEQTINTEAVDSAEVGVAARAATPASDFSFDPESGTITGYLGTDTEINIPSSIGSVSVTRIGSRAFFNDSLTSVTIPNGVISIGEYAFWNCGLTRVTIPNSVKVIEKEAFKNNSLSSVVIPNYVTKIGEGAFESNQLTNVTIPDSVQIIGGSAFRFNQLTGVTISNSILTINSYTFANNLIKSVTIPDGVNQIGNHAFYCNKLTNIIIPNNVSIIGSYAFCDNLLTKVTMTNSVTNIGEGAFQNNKLNSFKIPGSISQIAKEVFKDNQLTSVTIQNSVTTIGSGAFQNNYLSSIKIPDSVTEIGDYAFYNNGLTSVSIPNSVISIGSNSFKQNSIMSVMSVSIPDSIKTITESGLFDTYVLISNPTIDQIKEHCFDPLPVNTYIKAGSNIRSSFTGTIIETLKMPIYVTGIIEGNNLNFTYKGQTAYVHVGQTTNSPPAIIGYAKSAVNVRNASGGSVIGTIPKGHRVQGVLVGNRVRFTYNSQTGYVYVSLLQATPVKVTTYIKANSIIRSAPNGSVVTKLWRPLLVSGTIEGAWLKFAYNGKPAYVAMSVTTTGNPAITGYATQKTNVRNTPGGSVIGTIPIGHQVKGVLIGNMVRFTYNGRTGYIYASLLQANPVKVTRYLVANSIIRSTPNGSMITKTWRPLFVTGTIEGAWLKFTYNGRTAYVAMSVTTTGNPAMTGYATQKINVRNAPGGSVIGTIPKGYRVSGVLIGNMVRFTFNGRTGYVYATLLKKDPI